MQKANVKRTALDKRLILETRQGIRRYIYIWTNDKKINFFQYKKTNIDKRQIKTKFVKRVCTNLKYGRKRIFTGTEKYNKWIIKHNWDRKFFIKYVHPNPIYSRIVKDILDYTYVENFFNVYYHKYVINYLNSAEVILL